MSKYDYIYNSKSISPAGKFMCLMMKETPWFVWLLPWVIPWATINVLVLLYVEYVQHYDPYEN